MNKSNAAISNFIDTKYIPLDPKIKIGIGVFILILPIALYFFVMYQPNAKRIVQLDAEKERRAASLKQVEAKVRNMPQFKLELAETQRTFEEASRLLPKEKEIPQLLKDISALGRSAGLDFVSFKPQGDVPRDFYAEIPVEINVRGPYHSMGYFFDQVSKLGRIVTVSNVNMSSPTREGAEMLLTSSCKLLTYRFTNQELPKKDNK